MKETIDLNCIPGQMPKINALVKRILKILDKEIRIHSRPFDYISCSYRTVSLLQEATDYYQSPIKGITGDSTFHGTKVIASTSDSFDVTFVKKRSKTFLLTVLYDK